MTPQRRQLVGKVLPGLTNELRSSRHNFQSGAHLRRCAQEKLTENLRQALTVHAENTSRPERVSGRLQADSAGKKRTPSPRFQPIFHCEAGETATSGRCRAVRSRSQKPHLVDAVIAACPAIIYPAAAWTGRLHGGCARCSPCQSTTIGHRMALTHVAWLLRNLGYWQQGLGCGGPSCRFRHHHHVGSEEDKRPGVDVHHEDDQGG